MSMSLDDFAQYVKKEIEQLPTAEGCEVAIHKVPKNNAIWTGITIHPEGGSIVPTVYLDDYYSGYQTGKISARDAVMEIEKKYKEYQLGPEVSVKDITDAITDFEKVKFRIYPRVIATEGNEAFLQNAVSRQFLDMSVTYHIDITDLFEEKSSASVPIDKSLMQHYGVDEDQLFRLAIINQREKGMDNLGMVEALKSMGYPAVMLPDIPPEEDPMHIVTTPDRLYGASFLLDPESLDKVAEGFGEGFMIIPSSIHELIVIPESKVQGPIDELFVTVKEVNANEVKPDEVLTDNVYHYDIQTKEVTVAEDKDLDLD